MDKEARREYQREYRRRKREEATAKTRPTLAVVDDTRADVGIDGDPAAWPSVTLGVETELAALPARIVRGRAGLVAAARRVAAELDADRTTPRAASLVAELRRTLAELHEEAKQTKTTATTTLARLRAAHHPQHTTEGNPA